MKTVSNSRQAAVLMIFVAGCTQASILGVSATATASYPGFVSQEDTGFLVLSSITASAVANGTFQSGSGFATSNAQALSIARLGALGGAASASTTDTAHTDYVSTGDTSAEFRDLLTVFSQTAAIGTPVDLVFTMTLEGTVDATGGARNGHALSDYLAASTITIGSGLASGGLRVEGEDAQVGQFYSLGRQLFVSSHVGDQLSLDGFMQVHAWAAEGGSTSSNFAGTAHFYADSLTPGVQLIGESGVNYASAQSAPEPGSLLLLGGGFMLIAWMRRRKPECVELHSGVGPARKRSWQFLLPPR